MTRFGIFIFDDAEELDFAGPWEVFTALAALTHEDSAGLAVQRYIEYHPSPPYAVEV